MQKIFSLSNSYDNDNGDDGDVGADENDKRSVIRGYIIMKLNKKLAFMRLVS